jgi:serine acetyltransferase
VGERGADPGLLELLREDYRAHFRTWHLPGFHAVALLRLGQWSLRSTSPFRPLMRAYYKVGFLLVRDVYGIEIPETVRFGRRVVIGHQHGIVVHPASTIGDDCVIRQGCTIGAGNDEGFDRQAPRLGNRVQLGAGSKVVGSVTIGDDVRIGPNAVVMTSIPPGAIVLAEAPRILRRRSTTAS